MNCLKVGHLGDEYQELVHQQIVSKEGPRFFKSDFWEFLTPNDWWAISLILLPVVAWWLSSPSKGKLIRGGCPGIIKNGGPVQPWPRCSILVIQKHSTGVPVGYGQANKTKDVNRALVFMHDESPLTIVNRDIKPDNVFLDENLNPEIVDIGLARLDEEENMGTKRPAGTKGYIAPEHVMYGFVCQIKSTYVWDLDQLP